MNINNPEKQIRDIARKNGPLFQMAISHLMDAGRRSFEPWSIKAALKEIDVRHDQYDENKQCYIMTREFEKNLVHISSELAKFDSWDLLLYIKKNVDIYDPDKDMQEKLEDDWDMDM